MTVIHLLTLKFKHIIGIFLKLETNSRQLIKNKTITSKGFLKFHIFYYHRNNMFFHKTTNFEK